MNSHWATQT